MATTTILFANDGVAPAPSVSSVQVVSGDGIQLAVEDGSRVVLYFSPDLAEVLSPAPDTSLVLEGTSGMAYTFTSSDEGMYQILVCEESVDKPHFTAPTSSYLEITPVLRPGDDGFPIPFGGSKGNN